MSPNANSDHQINSSIDPCQRNEHGEPGTQWLPAVGRGVPYRQLSGVGGEVAELRDDTWPPYHERRRPPHAVRRRRRRRGPLRPGVDEAVANDHCQIQEIYFGKGKEMSVIGLFLTSLIYLKIFRNLFIIG